MATTEPAPAADAPHRETAPAPTVPPTSFTPAESARSAEEVLVADSPPTAGTWPEPSSDADAKRLEAIQSSQPLPSNIPPPAVEAITARMVQERAVLKKERIVHDPPVHEKPIRTRHIRPDYG